MFLFQKDEETNLKVCQKQNNEVENYMYYLIYHLLMFCHDHYLLLFFSFNNFDMCQETARIKYPIYPITRQIINAVISKKLLCIISYKINDTFLLRSTILSFCCSLCIHFLFSLHMRNHLIRAKTPQKRIIFHFKTFLLKMRQQIIHRKEKYNGLE